MRHVALVGASEPRALPERLFGFNTPVVYAVPHEDPAMVTAARDLAPAFFRFPGGTPSSFFDWRSGQMVVPDAPGASAYRRRLVQWAPATRRAHPNGCAAEHFSAVAREAGAELIFVPNLETSTVDEQAAWVQDMASKGVMPRLVEMGNEFYLALMGDAESRRRFPDFPTTLKLTKQYADAFAPWLASDRLIGVQSAGSRFYGGDAPAFPFLREWDDALTPEPWFDAVTTHLYTRVEQTLGREAIPTLESSLDRAFPALMARADAGIAREVGFLTGKLPGRQVWVTEFGPGIAWGGTPLPGATGGYGGLWLHVLARMMLAMLREPAVTVALFHPLFFDGSFWAVCRPRPGGGYEPIGPHRLLRWFFRAANFGGTYRPIEVDGARRVESDGLVPGESFLDVEAALLERPGRLVLLAQNASATACAIDLSSLCTQPPREVQTMATQDLLGAAVWGTASTSQRIEAPPFSLIRAEW